MSLGEAAAFLVIEDAEHCRARGGRVHARLAGYGMSTDAHHVIAPHPDSEGMIHAMHLALKDARLPPTAVGYVNAHGTGTQQNDRVEAQALRHVFGEGAVLVSSTKSLIGHTMAGAGSVEAAATILALQHELLPPTANLETVDPEVAFDCLPGHRAPREDRRGPVQLLRLRRPERQPDLRARRVVTDRRVVVTGVGTVNASTVGGRDALTSALALGRSAIGPVRTFDAADLTSRLAAEVDEATVASLVDRDAARRLSRICRLTLGACLLAVRDAGIQGGPGLGTVVGTEHGDFTSSRDFAQGFLRHGPAGLSPMIFPNTVMNAMAATAAIAIGAKAPSITVNQATLAGDLAVARGARLIVDGRADAVVAGGVDELFPEVYRRLAEMGALSPMQSRRSGRVSPLRRRSQRSGAGRRRDVPGAGGAGDRAGAGGANHRRDRGGGVGQRADCAAHRAPGTGRSRLTCGRAGPLVRPGAGGSVLRKRQR